MEKLKIGKIVSVGTHGLKGELKIDQIVILLMIKDLKKETKLLYVIKIKIWSIKLLHRGYTKEII